MHVQSYVVKWYILLNVTHEYIKYIQIHAQEYMGSAKLKLSTWAQEKPDNYSMAVSVGEPFEPQTVWPWGHPCKYNVVPIFYRKDRGRDQPTLLELRLD